MPAEIGQPSQLDAVVLAKNTQVTAQMRTFAAPAADADVDVVALREDPAVAAGHSAELEHEHPVQPSQRKLLVRKVALERHAVDDPTAQAERSCGDPVRAVGADHRADLDRLSVDTQLGRGVDGGVHALAKLDPCGDCLLDQKRVEPAALCHQAEHARRFALDLGSVPQPAAHARDPVFHDGLDGERQLPDGPRREPTSARLVSREARLVY